MKQNFTRPCAGKRLAMSIQAGFTLMELMIVVAIIAILAVFALPLYADYVTRAKLVDATNALSSLAVRMEQYYQDNRTYMDTATKTGVWPCDAAQLTALGNTLKKSHFTVDCSTPVPTATTFTLRAVGSQTTNGFFFTINQEGTRATTGTSPAWGGGSSASDPTCWMLNKGGC